MKLFALPLKCKILNPPYHSLTKNLIGTGLPPPTYTHQPRLNRRGDVGWDKGLGIAGGGGGGWQEIHSLALTINPQWLSPLAASLGMLWMGLRCVVLWRWWREYMSR